MMRYAGVAALAVALMAMVALGCEPATDPVDYDDFVLGEGEGELGKWVQSGYYSRTYYLHTPPNIDDGELHPLMIFLHGTGGTGEGLHQTLRPDAVTDAHGIVTVFPDGMERTWTVGCGACTFAGALQADDPSFLDTLARHLARHLPIDTLQVYVVGFSLGGSLAHYYGCQSEVPLAGLGSVAALVYRTVRDECEPAADFPVSIVHGTGDLIAYYEGFGIEAPVISVPETVEMWVNEMGCDPTPFVGELPDTADDDTSVTSFRFEECYAGSSVEHLRVNRGGHTWPGDTGPWSVILGAHSRDIDATLKFVEFFQEVSGGQ